MASTSQDEELQKLLDLIAGTTEEKNEFSIEKFIQEFDIVASEYHHIPLYKLQTLYNSWAEEPIGVKELSGKLKKYFKIERLIKGTNSTDLALCWVNCEKADEISETLWQKKARLWKETNKRRSDKRRKKRAEEKERIKKSQD